MNKLLISLLLASVTGLAACQPQEAKTDLRKDMNGMILGNDSKPAQPFYVGVGDTATRLMERNPFLKPFKLSDQEELRLPLMTKLDLHYDDGDVKLHVGCAFTTNVDGDERIKGASFIGIKLCEQPLNDWKPALQRAQEIMRQLEQQNPQIQNLREFYINASEPELQKIGGTIWSKSNHDIDVLRTVEEADAKFAQEAANGNEEIMSERRRNTYAKIGVYASSKILFSIGINKSAHYGGDNLTDAERKAMRYEVTMNFRLRNDVDLAVVKR